MQRQLSGPRTEGARRHGSQNKRAGTIAPRQAIEATRRENISSLGRCSGSSIGLCAGSIGRREGKGVNRDNVHGDIGLGRTGGHDGPFVRRPAVRGKS